MIKIKILNDIKKLHLKIFGSFPKIVLSNNQEKEAIPTKETQEIVPDKEYYGLSKVIIKPIPDEYIIPQGNLEISQNGTYDVIDKASVNVNIPIEEINLQEKSISVATNGSVEVTADSGYTGLSKVNVSNTQELEQINVIPTTEIQTITPSENKLINQVNVSAIPSEYIIPSGSQSITENGTYDITNKESVNVDVQPNLQIKNATPTTSSQNIIADEEYDGLSSVSISAVDSSIDSNIVASNIKNGVQILGVTGTLNEGITPSGELAITENGTYDVTNYASANVNVPEKQLGTKTITSNGIYKATDDNLDGYSEVEVATSGVDINDYFKNSIEEGNNSTIASGQWARSVKKLPAFTFNGKNASYHFYSFRGNSIDVSSFDTSNVTTMNSMFSGCSSLTSLDLSSFNTVNVTNMVDMFRGCSSLTSLDLSGFNTTNAINMNNMFRDCSSLTSLDVSSFNTTNVTNMTSLFNSCSSLTSLDISSFNTSNVTNMGGMFYNCSSLTSLDVSSFNTLKVTNMESMFYYCRLLTNIDLSNFNTSNVTSMYGMFRECSGLTSLDLSNLTATSLTNANMMFYNCFNITSIDLSNFENTKTVSVSQMFQYCSKLSNLNMSKFDFTKISSYSSMFNYVPKNCYILVKDEAQKTAFNTKFPTMTNVHYVGEEG